ncbi:PHO85 cyclin-1 [Ancistrocladus abbreviatus]
MGEEVRMTDYCNGRGGGDNVRALIPSELVSAFSIKPEPHRTSLEVNRASQSMLSSIRRETSELGQNGFESFSEKDNFRPEPLSSRFIILKLMEFGESEMGEEVRMTDYYGNRGGGDDVRVLKWEVGLLGADVLTPLSQSLILSELALAFSIKLEPSWTSLEVNRASQSTLSSIRGEALELGQNGFESFSETDNFRVGDLIELFYIISWDP